MDFTKLSKNGSKIKKKMILTFLETQDWLIWLHPGRRGRAQVDLELKMTHKRHYESEVLESSRFILDGPISFFSQRPSSFISISNFESVKSFIIFHPTVKVSCLSKTIAWIDLLYFNGIGSTFFKIVDDSQVHNIYEP